MSVSVGAFRAHPALGGLGGRELLAEVVVEIAEDLFPLLVADGDLVERFLEPGREAVVHEVAEFSISRSVTISPIFSAWKAAIVEADIAAVLDRRDDRSVGRRATDALLLELLDEARLRSAQAAS